MHSRFNWGNERIVSRTHDVLMPVSGSRSLLAAQMSRKMGDPNKAAFQDEPFTDESEALQEIMDQEGEGILDIAKAAFKFGKKAVGVVGKVSGAIDTAKTVGGIVHKLATGKVGTTISNVLSEKFNKNPNWRPGFPGEAHLVLPTEHGLTRSNFCGPGTNLQKRQARGDRGVSQIDSSCEIHDTLYNQARSEKDIRDADERLIRDIDKATDAGATQKAILKAGIRAKTLGEDIGLFSAETFTSIPGLRQEGSGLQLNGLRRSLANIPHVPGDFGHLRQNKFLNDASRDVRSLLHSGFARSGLSAMKRMGGNGIIHPTVISDDNLMRLARRLASRKGIKLGNVNPGDPTLSGQTHGSSGASQGRGIGSAIGVQHPNRQIKIGRRPVTTPMNMTDISLRKAIDPTIRNMGSLSAPSLQTGRGPFKTADPIGGGINIASRGVSSGYGGGHPQAGLGIVEDVLQVAEKPADLLRKNVLKSLKKKNRKKLVRKAKPVIRHAIKDVPAVIEIVKKMLKKKGLIGSGQHGGQFGILAALAASVIVPEIVKAIKGKGMQVGAGEGKKIALEVARRHGINAKNLGMSAGQVSKLILDAIKKADKGLHGKGLSGPALPGQAGGQFGILASLAASVIVPEIIKAIRK